MAPFLGSFFHHFLLNIFGISTNVNVNEAKVLLPPLSHVACSMLSVFHVPCSVVRSILNLLCPVADVTQKLVDGGPWTVDDMFVIDRQSTPSLQS